MNRWYNSKNVIIQKFSIHVKHKIPYKAYILDILYLKNCQNDAVL